MPTKKEAKMKMLLDKNFKVHSVIYRATEKGSLISSVYLKKIETLEVFKEFPEEIILTIEG